MSLLGAPQLLLFSSAWCNSHPDDSLATKLKPPNVGDTLNYWANRLTPLLGTDVAFVAADRVGTEPCAPMGKEGCVSRLRNAVGRAKHQAVFGERRASGLDGHLQLSVLLLRCWLSRQCAAARRTRPKRAHCLPLRGALVPLAGRSSSVEEAASWT